MTAQADALGDFETEIITEPMGLPRSAVEYLAQGPDKRGPGKMLVLSTRRLERLYRLDLLIEALQRAWCNLPLLDCVICGDGSLRAKLESMVRSIGLEEIEFVGWKYGDEYLDLVARADIYVSCSESDSTSVSLLEAMAGGAIPVVTDIPGNREWVTDGESALMFPVGDVDALASCLIRAARDHPLRRNAAALNRRSVGARAIWENNMGRIEKAFEEIVTRFRQ
jgi:glycosyltransferase involved in cell wall biosynthesis